MSAQWGTQPFDAQVRFFAGKDLVPTERWNDLWKEAHDTGFMVAGAMKADLLADLHAAVAKAINDGTTLETFRQDFDQIVAKHGWTGWRGEGSEAGRAWRTRLIYDTNLIASYQAGRWAQIQAGKATRPYLEYRHSDLSVHPRPLHKSWNGKVIPVDDPWWRTHWPPNGWGCKCRAFALNERDLRRLGKTKPDAAPDDGTYEWVDRTTGETHVVPSGIDPGWDYVPGSLRGDLLQQIERKAATLPRPIGEALAAEAKQIPPAVAAPPMVPPVSKALRLQRSAGELAEAVAAIDAVHGDGVLPAIPVERSSAKSYLGAFRAYGRTAHDIRIATQGEWKGLTLAHEVGHFLHHQAIGERGLFDYPDTLWSGFLSAANNSQAIKNLRLLNGSKYRNYLLHRHEIWARAYAQWIALRSENQSMRDGVANIVSKGGVQAFSQWSDADFEPIAAAIDDMMSKLGWR